MPSSRSTMSTSITTPPIMHGGGMYAHYQGSDSYYDGSDVDARISDVSLQVDTQAMLNSMLSLRGVPTQDTLAKAIKMTTKEDLDFLYGGMVSKKDLWVVNGGGNDGKHDYPFSDKK
jgi:hypothetical protein